MRGPKPEFRPTVIRTGNHGSYLSKGVVAGRGVGVGDGSDREGDGGEGLLTQPLHTPRADL